MSRFRPEERSKEQNFWATDCFDRTHVFCTVADRDDISDIIQDLLFGI